MSSNAFVFVILFSGGILLTAGDILFKFWVEQPRPSLYIAGLALYMIGAMCLIETYKSQNIAIATAIFILFNLLTLALASWLYFKQSLTLWSLVGLILAAAAIVCLELAS